ncbi:MAG TPA: hypothetical protein PL187_11015 [Caldilinea sp.]|mgnify:CR=1 FL=1|nr:hypothetical protein [Caldilinea sp.]
MWYATEFNSVPLPKANFSLAMPRAFIQNRIPAAGAVLGEYDLEGASNRQGQQTYDVEFLVADCDFQAKLDAILGAARRRGVLKISDSKQARRATGKVVAVDETTTMNDWRDRKQRIRMQIACEPQWYADVATTVTFTSATAVSLKNTPNRGNARAIQFVVLTITSSISGSLTINSEPQGDNYYGTPKYGKVKYGSAAIADGSKETAQLVYGASTSSTLVIDAGNSTVKVGGVDAYANITRPETQMALLWIEPGDNIIRFSQAVSGNIVFRSAWI